MQSAALPTASGLCNERRRRNSAVSGLRSSTNPRVSFPFYHEDTHPNYPLQATPFIPIPPYGSYQLVGSQLVASCLPYLATLFLSPFIHRFTPASRETPPRSILFSSRNRPSSSSSSFSSSVYLYGYRMEMSSSNESVCRLSLVRLFTSGFFGSIRWDFVCSPF